MKISPRLVGWIKMSTFAHPPRIDMEFDMKIAVGLAFILTACVSAAPPTWTKPDATDVDFRTAMADCRMEAARQPLIPKTGSLPAEAGSRGATQADPGVSVQDMADFRRAVAECMSARGWTRR